MSRLTGRTRIKYGDYIYRCLVGKPHDYRKIHDLSTHNVWAVNGICFPAVHDGYTHMLETPALKAWRIHGELTVRMFKFPFGILKTSTLKRLLRIIERDEDAIDFYEDGDNLK